MSVMSTSRRPRKTPGTIKVLLRVEALEDRALPSVDLLNAFEGLRLIDGPRYVPPDTHAAAGPSYVVETVNSSVAFYQKDTGARTFLQPLRTFFAPIGPSGDLFDPVVTYIEPVGKFAVVGIDSLSNGGRFIDIAFSDTSNPLDGFTDMRRIDGTVGAAVLDYPKIGWNADALVVTFNMFGAGSPFTQVVAFDLNSPAVYKTRLSPGAHFTSAPATMRGSMPGEDVLYFVERGTPTSIRVIKETSVLSDAPVFTPTDVAVSPYTNPPPATQPGGGNIDAFDAGIMNAEWRGDRLVAGHTVNSGGVARVRWYEFDTTGTPALIQNGEIDQGPGVATFFPSLAIAANGDLGMTFMESSPNEFLSVYITGQKASEAPGPMQTPVVSHPGGARYTGGRAGDYSAITVDPVNGCTFWAANMYKPNAGGGTNWGTGIAHFRVLGLPAVQLNILAPASATSGVPFTITIQALDAAGNIDNGYQGTIQFRSSDDFATLPDDYTFTVDDCGVHSFTVTLVSPGDQTITAADANDITGTATVTVTAGPGKAPIRPGQDTSTPGSGKPSAVPALFLPAMPGLPLNPSTSDAPKPNRLEPAVPFAVAVNRFFSAAAGDQGLVLWRSRQQAHRPEGNGFLDVVHENRLLEPSALLSD